MDQVALLFCIIEAMAAGAGLPANSGGKCRKTLFAGMPRAASRRKRLTFSPLLQNSARLI
jgi:hypothetical protein